MVEQTVATRLTVDASAFKKEMQESGKVAGQLAGDVKGAGGDIDKTFAGLSGTTEPFSKGVKSAGTDVEQLSGDVRAAGGEIDRVFTGLVDAPDKLTKGMKDARGAATSLGGALASAGAAEAIDSAVVSSGKLQAQLGLTADEAREFDAVAKEVYRNNFGDSMGEAAQVTGMVHQSLGLVGEELAATTQSIFSISDAFEHVGADTQILTDNVRSMTANFPGLDEAHALDLIAHGFQSGAGNAGDLQDTLQEYPGDFARLGLSADDMLGLLNVGMENGIRNTDNMADAVREMGIRISTAGDTGQQALAELFPAEEASRLIRDVTAGGEAGREAFFTILEGLTAIEDPQRRYNMAIEIMGTRGEEIANQLPGMRDALLEVRDGTVDAGGAAESTESQYRGFRNTLDGLIRTLETSVVGTLGDVGVGVADVGANAGIAVLGLKGLHDMLPETARGLGSVGRNLGVIARVGVAGAVIGGVAVGVNQLREAMLGGMVPEVEDLALALQGLVRTGEIPESVTGSLDGLGDAIARIADPSFEQQLEHIKSGFMGLGGLLGDDLNLDAARMQIEGIDEALSQMVASGDLDDAAASFDEVARRAAEQGISVEQVRALLPEYAQALEAADVANQGAAGSTDDYDRALGDLDPALDDAATSQEHLTAATQDYQDLLRAATDPVFALTDALSDVDDAQQSYNDAVEEYGRNSPEARAAAMDLAEAVRDAESAAIDGNLSYEDFTAQLDRWVDQGAITAEQAEVIKGRVDDAREAAEEYEGGYMAQLRADVSQAEGALDGFIAELQSAGFGLSKSDAVWSARLTAQANAELGDGPGRAGGSARRRVEQAMQGIPGLRVTSAYRDPAHNARVGGSPTSYHLDAANPAVDVAGPMASLDRLYQKLHGTGRELIWRAPGHYDHLHYANRGMLVPGSGNTDTVPAMLTPGEYVINADAVDRYGVGLFSALNAQQLNSGGLVGGGFYDVAALFGMTRGPSGQGADAHLQSIEAMVAAYEEMDRLLDEMEQKKRRQQQLDRVAAADTAEARRDARDALAEFDREARLSAERRQIEARIAAAEANQQIRANRELYEFERMATADQIAVLSERMSAERRFNDEWMRLNQQRIAAIERERSAMQAAVDDAQRAFDSELGALTSMLDDADRIRGQQADSEARHAEQTAAAQQRYAEQTTSAREQAASRIADAESAAAEQTVAAHENAAQAIDQAVAQRRQQLASELSLDFGGETYGAETLGRIVDWQTDQLDEWSDALQELRGRGVSDEVIDALKLSDGPGALNQIRRLLEATDSELFSLNASIGRRIASINDTVAQEQTDQASDLYETITGIERDRADEVARIRRDSAETVRQIQSDLAATLQQAAADHNGALADLNASFAARQQQFAADMAAIGQQSGWTYAEAIAAGIASGIPGIVAQVEAVERALAGLEQAQEDFDAFQPQSVLEQVASVRQSLGLAASAESDAIWADRINAGTHTLADAQAAMQEIAGLYSQVAAARSAAGLAVQPESDKIWVDRLRAGTHTMEDVLAALADKASSYDVGGVLSPGLTLAYNGTGRDEYVLTGAQLATVVAGGGQQAPSPVNITLQLDGKQFARATGRHTMAELRDLRVSLS